MNFTVIFFIMLALAYFLFLRLLEYLEKRSKEQHPLSDEEILSLLAYEKGCSEFEIFRLATQGWQVSENKVELDFNTYLTQSLLPFYVRDYIRKNRHKVSSAS